MKKVFKMTMAGFVIMAATAIQAQPQNGDKRPSGEEMIKNEVKKMEEKLSLTAKESEEMKTIYTSFFEKIKDDNVLNNLLKKPTRPKLPIVNFEIKNDREKPFK